MSEGEVGPDPDRRAARPLRIGLTGPIGCGKSTVAGWLVAWGGIAVDADALARDVTRPGEPTHDAVLAHFGERVRGPEGALDRGALATIVFADPSALRELEAIVHPAVRPRILRALAEAGRAGADLIVLEAIKLIESGYAPLLDEVWLITCSEAEQLARLAARGQTDADARRRIAAQFGLAERLAPAATRLIDTGGSLDAARRRVAAALEDALRRQATADRDGNREPGAEEISTPG